MSSGKNNRRPGAVTALEIDAQCVRVAQAVPRGNRTSIVRVEVAPLHFEAEADRSDPAVVGAGVARALESLRWKAGPAAIGVPRHSVVLRTLTVPAIEDIREVASMVHMQIGRDLPFRTEDAVIDFTILESPSPKAGDGANSVEGAAKDTASSAKLEVLVAAMRRETVEYYRKLASAAGIKLIALGWLSQANARCLTACQAAEGPGAVALVSLRTDEVGIDIVAGQSLLFSRGAALPLTEEKDSGRPEDKASAPESTSADEQTPSPPKPSFKEAVLIEVVRSLHSYSGVEAQAPVTTLFITGATGSEDEIITALRERLSIPCKRLEPGAALELPEEMRSAASGAIGAMGLGLGVNDADGLPFDFLNPKRPAVQRDLRRIITLSAIALGTLLLVGLLGLRTHLIRQRTRIKQSVDAEVAEAQKKSGIYRAMQQQATLVQNWTKEGRSWLDHYAYLSAVLPASEDLYVTSISISGQGAIHLAVQARSGEILASLDRQLRAAGYEVKPLAITPGNDKYGYNFRSTVELIVPPKMKVDLAKAQIPARPADDGSLDPKPRAKGSRR